MRPNLSSLHRPSLAALGVAAQQEARCKAQWAAYAQSQRCFNACGVTGREGARNNAACGHCTDTPMPGRATCWRLLQR